MPMTDKLVLLRTFKERFYLVLFCSAFTAFMAFMLHEMSKWKPVGIIEHLVRFAGVEIFTTFGLFSVLGVIWGLFAPSWLERLLQRMFRKVVGVIGAIGVVSILSVVLHLLMR